MVVLKGRLHDNNESSPPYGVVGQACMCPYCASLIGVLAEGEDTIVHCGCQGQSGGGQGPDRCRGDPDQQNQGKAVTTSTPRITMD